MIPAHTEDLTPDGTADFVLVYDASAGGHKKVKLNNLPTAGGGEINTGSNVGTGAGQVFKAKSGVNFEFRNLAAGSSKLTVTNGANDITLDVAQANIDHDALTNFVANEHLDWTADLGATNLHDNNLSTNIPRIATLSGVVLNGVLGTRRSRANTADHERVRDLLAEHTAQDAENFGMLRSDLLDVKADVREIKQALRHKQRGW